MYSLRYASLSLPRGSCRLIPGLILFCRKIRARLLEAEIKAAAAVARGEIAIPVDLVDGELEDEAEVGGLLLPPLCLHRRLLPSACIPPTLPPDILQSAPPAGGRDRGGGLSLLHASHCTALHPPHISPPDTLQSSIGSSVPLCVQLRRYATRHDEIMETADTIFLDAGEEFASVASVKTALEEFKLGWVQEGRGHHKVGKQSDEVGARGAGHGR